MSQSSIPAYPRHVTYNFSQWGSTQPVRLGHEGQQFFGYLCGPGDAAPYHVLLTERIASGASHRIPPRELQLQSLDGVRFLHAHSH